MSDTLADLASWLPWDFLTGDMDDKPPFLNPHRLPYDFAYSSSTESESDDDDNIPGLTRRFTRSVSLQERLRVPYPVEKKRVFSRSPESTLNWNVFSSPTTPFGQQPDEDAWDLLYAAAGQVARMKMTAVNHGGFVNRGLLVPPRPLGPPLSHNNRNSALLRSENETFIRQQLLRERVVTGGVNYGGGGHFVAGRPVGFGQSAWPPHPVETQRRQQPVPVGSNGRCGRTVPVVKKGCAGTGVFLPRNYSNVPPELKKKPVSPTPANPPARMAPLFNKNPEYIIGRPQTNIQGVYSRQHQVPPLPHHQLKCEEVIMAHRQKGVVLGQQRRSSSHDGVRVGPAEVVLPQEWTY